MLVFGGAKSVNDDDDENKMGDKSGKIEEWYMIHDL